MGKRSLDDESLTQENYGFVYTILPWVIFASLVIYFYRRNSGSFNRTFNENNNAVAFMGRGELSKAAALFDELLRGSRDDLYYVIVMTNRARLYILQGEQKSAQKILHEAMLIYKKKEKMYIGVHADILLKKAHSFALSGELNKAEEFSSQAADVVSEIQRGFLVPIHAIIALRQARMKSANRIFKEEWKLAEGSLDAGQMKHFRLLHAFALNSINADTPAAETILLLQGLQQSYPGEYTYLGGNWPEMREFLARHQLQ